MTSKSILDTTQIKEFETYHSSFNKYETVKKIFKIATIILGLCAIGSFSSLFIFQISSELLLGSFIFSASASCIFLMSKNILGYFQSKIKKPTKITPKTLIKSLDDYNYKSPSLDPKTYIGKIEKIDLEKDSKLILKADFHGDFFSLIEHLKALQKQGILDANLKVSKESKGKVVIAFLGDYLDRGEYSFEIVDLLIKLKINNPDEVVLIKGNHENLEISNSYIHQNEKHFYLDKNLCKKLSLFFSTLPLAVFVGSKDENDKYQYTCLSHGALDPDIDVTEVLQSRSKKATMYIRKDKKASLSKRISNLLPKHLIEKKLSDIKSTIQALEEFINNQTANNLKKVQDLLKTSNIDKKKAKQILSILKVQDFLKTYSPLIERERIQDITSFNWGDITTSFLGPNFRRGAGLCLTSEFVKDYFRAVSTENRQVKALRAGHAHSNKVFSLNGKKGFIEILPVAGELKCYDSIRSPVDRADMITIAPKVKEWKKHLLLRQRANVNTILSPEKAFYCSKHSLCSSTAS